MVASTAVMPSSGPLLDSAPTSITRSPIERPSWPTVSLAAASAPQISRSHSMSRSASASSWAAMWWKAATTFASGSSACTSSAEEPTAGGVKRRGPPKVSGTTVLTTTLPRHASRASGSVLARPAAGNATTITSPSAAASAFVWPTMGMAWAAWRSSAALAFARSASREPMMIEWPNFAQRMARPAPSLPVPPRIAMFRGRLLSEEVAGRIAQQRLGAFLARHQRDSAHDGGRNAIELAHDRLGGAGQLVGNGEDGGLQRPAGGILLAQIAEDGREARHADGDVDEALAPRPPERVGDDHVHLGARARAHGVAKRARRAVGVHRQQRHHVGVHVRLIDAGVGAYPAVVRLGHQHAAVHADDAARLAQDHLDQARIAPETGGERRRHLGRRDVRQPQQAALRLGDDLLAQHHHVAGGQRCALPLGRLHHDPRDVVARADLPDALDADDLVARRHGQARAIDRTPASRSGSRQRVSSAWLSVPAPSVSSATRSLGSSTSRPRPRSFTIFGSRRSAWAAARWLSNDGSPKRRRMTAGGASTTPLVPRAEREGANTAAGGAPRPPSSARISTAVTQGTSPGIVMNAVAPARTASACPVATAAVWPRLSSSPMGSAPRLCAMAATSGSRVTTHTRSRRAAASARSTSTSIARASSRRSGPSSTRMSRCLALTMSLTGTAATIMRPGPCPYARSLPPPRA